MNKLSKKKICIITSAHKPFDIRIFQKQAQSLRKAGYEVVLVAPHNKSETVDGISISALKRPGSRFGRFLQTTTLLSRVRHIGADIYHFHDPELLPAMAALRILSRKPIIYDVHEHYPASIMSKHWIPKPLRHVVSLVFRLVERISISFFQAIVYTTPPIGSRYKNFSGRSVRLDNYPLKQRFIQKPAASSVFGKVIYVGGICEIRGMVELVQAFSLVSPTHAEAELILVGACEPPKFKTKITNIVEKAGVLGNVRLIEALPYEQLIPIMCEGYVGVVPYLPYPNHLVTLPNKLFEYMASSIPVVVSDFPLYREIVTEADCGLLVDPTRPEAIAEAINYLLNNPNQAEKMGQNGRRAFLNKYNWESESKKLLALYSELLSKATDAQPFEPSETRDFIARGGDT